MNTKQSLVQCARLGRSLVTSNQFVRVQNLSTSVARTSMYDPPDYSKKYAKYAKFQIPDGVPVHLKGGVTDKVLLYITYGLCGYGLYLMFTTFYTMAYPKKEKKEVAH